jgi:hypothetical protein
LSAEHQYTTASADCWGFCTINSREIVLSAALLLDWHQLCWQIGQFAALLEIDFGSLFIEEECSPSSAWRKYMQAAPITQRSLVLSYLGLRRSLGAIGIALPIVLALGKMLLESPGLLDSISSYYYSVMRDVLVGSLCAMAVFLFSYRYRLLDDIAGDVAGVCALGIAFFPTAPMNATTQQMVIGWAHWVFGVGFFLTLAFFALVLFRKTDPSQQPTRQKRRRNMVYLVCGIAILVCLALTGLVQMLPGDSPLRLLHPVFWLESLAIFAFGIAWFIKGETLLKDG